MGDDKIKANVKKKYAEIATNRVSCSSKSCCCGSTPEDLSEKMGYSKEELNQVPEGANLGLGCGNPTALANLKQGEVVLDLGSGAGFDAFLAANRVGPSGKVIGVDMTEDMIEKAKDNAKDYKNVEFRLGEIENMPVEDNSIDVIISNCVINLSPDKQKVFNEAYRVLKPGGRLFVSDIVTEGSLPEDVKKDLSAWASCIAGAMEKTEYLTTMEKAGFKDVKIIAQDAVVWKNLEEELKGKLLSIKVEAHKR